jgi:hypothetical protein
MRYLDKSFTVPYMGKAYRENWDRIFGGREPTLEWNGAKLTVRMTWRGSSTHIFHVDLVGGEWPSDGDLVTLCDGDTPPNARHFGGEVLKSADGKSAEVSVYVD